MNTLMVMLPVLAAISGDAILKALIWLVVFGLIFWILNWFIGYVGLGEPWNKVARVILALFAVVIVINFLLSIAGRPFINF